MLLGISRVESLRDALVLKGGTALKKCYFGDYRFSDDLDFSTVGDLPTGDAVESAVRDACGEAARMLHEYAPVDFTCERYTERDPHPGGQEAFTIRARLPWQRAAQTRVMVEITTDEKVLRPGEVRFVIHEYGEKLDARVKVYALEEIMAEKLRAILQHVEKLKQRGWSRSRARDYYDLWRILTSQAEELNVTGFDEFLRKKCEIRGVTLGGPDDFFQESMLDYVGKTWEQWLGPLVPGLPSFGTVVEELRPRIERILLG